MAFCGNCGTKVEDGVKFCPGCGAAINAQPQQAQAAPQQNYQQQAQQNVPPVQDQAQQQSQQNYQQAPPNEAAKEPKDVTHMFDPADIEKNKAMGLLGYLIFFIPLLAAKDSAFAKFHANQGFVLFLSYIVASVLWIIPILGWIAAPIVYIAVTVLSIMGIINALGGKAINLPIVGKLKIFK